MSDYQPSYNIAPGQAVYALLQHHDGIAFHKLAWGFIPHWAKIDQIKQKPINARLETAADKPYFRTAFRSGRCLVLASGYYEWQQSSSGKQPYYMYAKDMPIICMAALWSAFEMPETGDRLLTCALLTEEASQHLKDIHHRKPLMILPKYQSQWLSTTHVKRIFQDLHRFRVPEDMITSHAVSQHVNRPSYNQPNCIEPIDQAK